MVRVAGLWDVGDGFDTRHGGFFFAFFSEKYYKSKINLKKSPIHDDNKVVEISFVMQNHPEPCPRTSINACSKKVQKEHGLRFKTEVVNGKHHWRANNNIIRFSTISHPDCGQSKGPTLSDHRAILDRRTPNSRFPKFGDDRREKKNQKTPRPRHFLSKNIDKHVITKQPKVRSPRYRYPSIRRKMLY